VPRKIHRFIEDTSSESLTSDPVGVAGVASLMMASIAWPAAQEDLAITFRTRAIKPLLRAAPPFGAASVSVVLIPWGCADPAALRGRCRPDLHVMPVIFRVISDTLDGLSRL